MSPDYASAWSSAAIQLMGRYACSACSFDGLASAALQLSCGVRKLGGWGRYGQRHCITAGLRHGVEKYAPGLYRISGQEWVQAARWHACLGVVPAIAVQRVSCSSMLSGLARSCEHVPTSMAV